jgi:ribosomal protein L22
VNDHFKTDPNPTWIARKFNVDYSAYKLMAVANTITGKHVYDALNTVNAQYKKGAPVVLSVLNAAIKNGQRKGFAEDRMFVKTSIVGKRLSHKKLDIKGRGRMGVIRVPRSSITITLEERSPQDFYKMIVSGKAPTGVAHTMRRMLFQNECSLEQVQRLAHITTSEGRFYRRTQFKRLISLVKKEY